MSQSPERIDDQNARALWKRAVEMQMADNREADDAEPLSVSRREGYSLEQVIRAAEGAGIDPSHLHMALAESRLPDAGEVRRDRWTARWMRFLVRGEDAIEISAVIDAPPDVAVSAFDAVVARPAFHLVQEDRVGPDPPLNGVLVYRTDESSATSFHGAMALADARVILLTARPEGQRTRLRLRLPLFEHGVNLAITGGFAGALGTAGGYGGAAAGGTLAGIVGTASLALAVAPAVVGAALGAGTGVWGFQRLSRWGRGRGEAELRRLLQAVAIEAQRSSNRG